ncbi:uncharacterized protein [Cherax quadricarinatus]
MEYHRPKVMPFTSDHPPVPAATATEFQWNRQKVHALISKVEEFFEDFYDPSKKKKSIWSNVAQRMQEEGYNCTGSECDKKWRNLKATYVKVLQKQIHGDNSYRFEYFDALHHILGKEIDPLGMRDQVKTSGTAASLNDRASPTHYTDLTAGADDFVWTDSIVHLLLDFIQERRDAFNSPSSRVDDVWEEIAQQMALEGHDVHSAQCQHKWFLLQKDFQYHQAEADATGSVSLWSFYTRVRDMKNTINISTNVAKECKLLLGDSSVPGPTRSWDTGRQPGSKTPVKGGEHRAAQNRSILDRVQQLEVNLGIDRRLQQLESRIESNNQQRNTHRQTNNVLKQILSELRRINNILEQQASSQTNQEVRTTVQHQHQYDQRPGSPGQGIIIVEAYSDQL